MWNCDGDEYKRTVVEVSGENSDGDLKVRISVEISVVNGGVGESKRRT